MDSMLFIATTPDATPGLRKSERSSEFCYTLGPLL